MPNDFDSTDYALRRPGSAMAIDGAQRSAITRTRGNAAVADMLAHNGIDQYPNFTHDRSSYFMATQVPAGAAPYYMMISFEILPEDEAEFNDIYDNDHIPNLMKLPGVLEIIRFRDAAPNDKGLLHYSALYLLAKENLHETAEWKALSEIGRWPPVIRPKVKSRARRAGPVVARFDKR